MNNFDLQSHLDTIYATYPEAGRQPIIGITANYADGDATLRSDYYRAGGGGRRHARHHSARERHQRHHQHPRPYRRTAAQRRRRLQPAVGGRRAFTEARASMPSATCPNCSSPAWPTTARFPCWAFAAAFKPWLWPLAARWHRTSAANNTTAFRRQVPHQALAGCRPHGTHPHV